MRLFTKLSVHLLSKKAVTISSVHNLLGGNGGT